jgi:hypothetical protein
VVVGGVSCRHPVRVGLGGPQAVRAKPVAGGFQKCGRHPLLSERLRYQEADDRADFVSIIDGQVRVVGDVGDGETSGGLAPAHGSPAEIRQVAP